MNLRTKAILFFGSFFLIIVLGVVFYAEYIVGGAFKEQISNDLRIFAEQTEGSYYTFLKSVKSRAVDWSSDPSLQRIVKTILDTKGGTQDRVLANKEFANYMIEKKMPYDKTVFLVDILDKNGIVVASTNAKRIGTDEREEEVLHKVSHFSKTITSKFGEAFVKSIVFEEDETTEPMVHATARFFAPKSSGEFTPLDAVLMVHFLNIDQIADVLSGELQVQEGAQSGKALASSYQTSEIYLVNSEKLMVTPSRYVNDIKDQQNVDTFPVRECLENNKEVVSEYDDYRGVRVFGASMCLESEGLVLLAEVSKDEIFLPITSLVRATVIIGGILLIFESLIIAFFVRLPLKRIDEVISALERVMNGDFATQAVVHAKDETGRLALMFNTMVKSINVNQKALQESKRALEEKTLILQKDVEEHKKQEKLLEESKKATLNLLEDSWKAKEKIEVEGNKLQTILASIGDGLVLIDSEYKIVLVNAKALEIFRMSLSDLLGKDLRDTAKLYRNKTYVEPEKWPIEEVFITKNAISSTMEDSFGITTKGRTMEFPISFSIAPLTGRFSGAVIVFRDATRDRELDEAKSGFISVASHQLRTPLTSIRWYSEMLLSEDAGALNDAQRDFMKEIHGGAERLYQTVDLLLGISRVESGKLKMDRTPIDIGVFTGEISRELASQIDMKNLSLAVVPPNREPVIVWLDSLTLRQVILNLLSNAIRYTNEHGLIELKWWVSDDGRDVVYMVHDNGIGIPDRERGRIFSKFFRAENARAQVPDGSGLGLALVKDLVLSWGGRVWFESFPGQGATFFFTIPLTMNVEVEK